MELTPELLDRLISVGGSAVLGLVTLLIGLWASRWLARMTVRLCASRQLDAALGRFLGQIVRYTVIAAAVIAALDRMGVQTTSVMAIFASAGLAVGLALQGSLSNFAAGVMILLFRPFKSDDVVTVAGETGRVDDVGLFFLTLVTPDNRRIIISNSAVTGGTIINFTAMGSRRTTVAVGVAYGSDIGTVMGVLDRAVRRAELVLEEPAPAVAFTSLGASSLDFAVHFWSAAPDWLAAAHNVRRAVYEDLGAAGIEIPFNQVVVHQAEAAK